jgi:hypothetical protein
MQLDMWDSGQARSNLQPGFSLTAPTERIHSEGAILSGREYLLMMYLFQAHLELHPPLPHVTFLPSSPVILLYFILYLPLYSSVYIPQLHFIQHGTFSQPGLESLFIEESRSPPCESTCMLLTEDSQSSLGRICLNFSPNLRVSCGR